MQHLQQLVMQLEISAMSSQLGRSQGIDLVILKLKPESSKIQSIAHGMEHSCLRLRMSKLLLHLSVSASMKDCNSSAVQELPAAP